MSRGKGVEGSRGLGWRARGSMGPLFELRSEGIGVSGSVGLGFRIEDLGFGVWDVELGVWAVCQTFAHAFGTQGFELWGVRCV